MDGGRRLPHAGPGEIRKLIFEAIGPDWDGVPFTLADLLDAGDTAVGVGTYTETHRTTGKSFTTRVARLWLFNGEVLASFGQIVDSAPVVAPAG